MDICTGNVLHAHLSIFVFDITVAHQSAPHLSFFDPGLNVAGPCLNLRYGQARVNILLRPDSGRGTARPHLSDFVPGVTVAQPERVS